MKYSKKDLVKGIKNWETQARLSPSKFESDEERLNTDIDEYSKSFINYLIAFMDDNYKL